MNLGYDSIEDVNDSSSVRYNRYNCLLSRNKLLSSFLFELAAVVSYLVLCRSVQLCESIVVRAATELKKITNKTFK